MIRSAEIERLYFARIADRASVDDTREYFEAVAARLRKGAEEYGENGFASRSFADLVCEAREEGEDFPGWLSLAINVLEAEAGGMRAEVVCQIENILVEAAAQVAGAWKLADLALELYEEENRRR
ncbi:MAG: hypothetical protein ACRD2Z_03280 [Thermoanaerobaculia bacterium]